VCVSSAQQAEGAGEWAGGLLEGVGRMCSVALDPLLDAEESRCVREQRAAGGRDVVNGLEEWAEGLLKGECVGRMCRRSPLCYEERRSATLPG